MQESGLGQVQSTATVQVRPPTSLIICINTDRDFHWRFCPAPPSLSLLFLQKFLLFLPSEGPRHYRGRRVARTKSPNLPGRSSQHGESQQKPDGGNTVRRLTRPNCRSSGRNQHTRQCHQGWEQYWSEEDKYAGLDPGNHPESHEGSIWGNVLCRNEECDSPD